MTAHVYCVLACNAAGCPTTFCAKERRADLTRARAAGEGWAYGYKPQPAPTWAVPFDYCPIHSELGGDLKPLPEQTR